MRAEARSPRNAPTNAEVNLRSRFLHKSVLYSVKIIPILISGIYVLNTVLSYYDIDWPGFSYIVQFLFILFMYLASLAFKFCLYHRLFIYYIALVLVLNIIDYHWGIPISDRGIFLVYMIITGVFLFFILFLHQRELRKNKDKSN